MTCYAVPEASCEVEPTAAPVTAFEVDISLSLSMSLDLSMSMDFNTDSPTGPTSTSPTPAMLFVCGVDYSDASNNFCSSTSCPTGDVSCFEYTICDIVSSFNSSQYFIAIFLPFHFEIGM